MSAAAWPLQVAIFNTLTGTTAVTVPVYDEVPPGGVRPYITIGPLVQVTDDDHNAHGVIIDVDIHVWTESEGIKQAQAIFATFDPLLHRQSLAVTGWTKVHCALQQSSEETDPDPEIRHLLCSYRVWLEKEGA